MKYVKAIYLSRLSSKFTLIYRRKLGEFQTAANLKMYHAVSIRKQLKLNTKVLCKQGIYV